MNTASHETAAQPAPDLLEGMLPESAVAYATTMYELAANMLGDYTICGGFAVRYNQMIRPPTTDCTAQPMPLRDVRDIDLIVSGSEPVALAIADSFRITHHHTGPKARGFYMQLVHDDTRLKVDVFTPRVAGREPARARVGALLVPVSTAEDQLAATVLDLQKIFDDPPMPVSPQQFEDAEILLQIVDEAAAAKAWRRISPFPRLPLDKAYLDAQTVTDEDHSLIKSNPYRKDGPYVCQECAERTDKSFPLTPLNEIEKLLGYVE